jgi:hypothetical protein
MGLRLGASAKSLQQQTQWRREWDSNSQYCLANGERIRTVRESAEARWRRAVSGRLAALLGREAGALSAFRTLLVLTAVDRLLALTACH